MSFQRALRRRREEGNTELAQKITDTLKAMDEDGTVKQLCEKYADYGLSYETGF